MNARADGYPQNRPRIYPYGVYHRERHGKYTRKAQWIVKFHRNKRTIYIGSFTRFIDACYAAALFRSNEIK